MREVRVLGPLQIIASDGAETVVAPKPRRLLAALVVADGRPCSVDALIDAVWEASPPDSARKLVQVYVSQLRKALPAEVAVVTDNGRYRLVLDGVEIDARRFEDLVREARRAFDTNPGLALGLVETALALWRGPAFGELADDAFLRAETGRLEELRLIALETRLELLVRIGRHGEALTDVSRLLVDHPLHERLQMIAMQALYRAGRQTDALAVYATYRSMLDEELGLEPGPELRDLHRRILAHDVRLALDPAAGARSPLPEAPNPLVGRDQELSEVCDLLLRDDVRLLVLAGAGGSGKTRLALEAARTVARSFRDGVVLVNLAPLRHRDQVTGAIARALGHSRAPADVQLDELGEVVGAAQLLLVLDNVEHLRDVAPLFVELLARAPDVTLLVTSRVVLHVSGEHVFPVPPLALEAATELFWSRVQARSADLARGAEDDRIAREICRRVDGLPLAVELAAARVGTLTPSALLERLDARLGILTHGPRDLPARQQTLRETIEWSVGLLGDDGRRALARLSVFRSGASLEAAEAVCGADIDQIATLVDHHLVQRTVQAGRPRLSLLETIHEFAAELLAADPDDRLSTRGRHAAWYRALAEEAEPYLSGGEQVAWLETLEAEHQNLRAALDHLDADGHAEEQLALAVLLSRFWYVRGYLRDGRRLLEESLERAAALPAATRRRPLTAAASLTLLQGDYAASTRFAERALEAAREEGEPRFVANALSNLGAIVLAAGDRARAEEVLSDALRLAREAGDERILALAVNNLGDFALTVGDHERAAPLFAESLELLRARGDSANIARSLFNNGAVDLMRGNAAAAAGRFRESLALCRTTGDREDTAWSLLGLAATEVEVGDAERGARLLGAARAVLLHMGADFKPFERRLHELTERRSRELLGLTGHDLAVAMGAATPLAEALSLVLEDDSARG